MAEILPIAKQIAVAQGLENYNILQVSNKADPDCFAISSYGVQNNGRIAHQVVE